MSATHGLASIAIWARGNRDRRTCSAGSDITASPTQFVARTRMRCGLSGTVVHMGTFYASREELVRARQDWKRAGKTVIFTNGCYDLLHPGHIRLLERARSLGDVLILALNTDSSVQRLKGPNRPVMSQDDRAAVALALEAVDAVTFFDEDTPRELIAEVLPDVLVKGADWSHFIAGREEVETAGGRVLALPLEPGYS